MTFNEKEIKRIIQVLTAQSESQYDADLITKFIQELKDIRFEKEDDEVYEDEPVSELYDRQGDTWGPNGYL